jgi:phosphoribosylaminoimidazole-succinocarboxamide synthase
VDDGGQDATEIDVVKEQRDQATATASTIMVRTWDRMDLSVSTILPLHVVVVSVSPPVRCTFFSLRIFVVARPAHSPDHPRRPRPDRQGKVRDIYDFGERLLIVATDRISAFDYVLGSGIPDKGKVLTQISSFWFERTRSVVANHVLSTDAASFPGEARRSAKLLQGRSMLVARTEPLPIECVARGYLSGSGWKDYVETGKVCGIRLPNGMKESGRLPEPIFTPATKAQSGHDINISEKDAADLVGKRVLERVRDLTLRLYSEGAAHAESCGIIVADTKFEFGLLPVARTTTAGRRAHHPHRRVLTPDSSRFWPVDGYHRAARSRASTNSSFATTWNGSSGTSSRRCRRSPMMSC